MPRQALTATALVILLSAPAAQLRADDAEDAAVKAVQ